MVFYFLRDREILRIRNYLVNRLQQHGLRSSHSGISPRLNRKPYQQVFANDSMKGYYGLSLIKSSEAASSW